MKPLDLNLTALKYFTDTIELGSLTLAAEKNHVTRPAISRAIRRLEDVVGYTVISHAKNQLELTETGRAFYSDAKRALSSFESILTGSTKTRPLRLACSATIAEFVVFPQMKALKHEIARSEIRIGTTAKVRDMVREGSVSLAITIDDSNTYGLKALTLNQGQFVLRSKSGELNEPLITTEPRPEVSSALKAIANKHPDLKSHQRIESWSLCQKMAEILGGTCLVPDIIPSKRLMPVRNLKFEANYRIIAIYKDKNLLNETELSLIESIRSS